jgi:hypothetical protein
VTGALTKPMSQSDGTVLDAVDLQYQASVSGAASHKHPTDDFYWMPTSPVPFEDPGDPGPYTGSQFANSAYHVSQDSFAPDLS